MFPQFSCGLIKELKSFLVVLEYLFDTQYMEVLLNFHVILSHNNFRSILLWVLVVTGHSKNQGLKTGYYNLLYDVASHILFLVHMDSCIFMDMFINKYYLQP